MIEFRVLGPLEVERDGAIVGLGGRRQRSALAILLLHVGSVVSVERLADDLYAGEAPASAVTQVHRHVSSLRKLLPEVRLETTSPGYVLRLEPEQLDLDRFERLAEEGVERLELGDLPRARALLGEALALWRGRALADLADEPFARSAVSRLDELRLAVLEQRFEADLALGAAARVVPDLQELAAKHPLRERLTELLMLALYRSGRQVDALAAYRARRAVLAAELGLEPGPVLRELEARILRQDPSLIDRTAPERRAEPPVVLAVAVGHDPTPGLLSLAASDSHETILLQVVLDETELAAAATSLEAQRALFAPGGRAAAFVAGDDWPDDVARSAASHDVALVLLETGPSSTGELPERLLRKSAADVAIVVRGEAGLGPGTVDVLFGGGEHEWAALELAAAVARAGGRPLRLVGPGLPPGGGGDSSRLLAEASLAVQRTFGVSSIPVLAPAAPDALLAVMDEAALVVAGIGSRWQSEGLGSVRAALVSEARSCVVLVHRGPRPGILAPPQSLTRFTWTLQN
jgi:DNA-binding SARP family transcriptional activator